MDRAIFLPPNTTSILAENLLWNEFRLFELTQIMRQKDEKALITALNNIAAGKTTFQMCQQHRKMKLSSKN